LPSLALIDRAGVPVKTAGLLIRLRRLAFLPLIRWLPHERLRLSLPLAVILIRLLKPLWLFCFGIYFIPSNTISDTTGKYKTGKIRDLEFLVKTQTPNSAKIMAVTNIIIES
jgi:hypothetical protein